MTARRQANEQGAALIMAIAVMVVVAAISASMFSLITSGVKDRSSLDVTRNREYAADAAIDTAIARVRGLANPGPGFADCAGPDTVTLNGVTIQVSCANAPTPTTALYVPRDVIFTAACLNDGASCPDGTVVIRAQVNYASPDGLSDYQTGHVTRTYIQSWSVNR